MKDLFFNSLLVKVAWGLLGTSVMLIVWQGLAHLTENIPGHILPIVRVLHGTQESVPVAFSWTLKLGLISLICFAGSGLYLTIHRVACCRKKDEKGNQ